MDAFIETVSQILIDWGYPGLFISALLAGSIVPFSSEIVLLGLVKLGLDPTLCLISASLGNTAGGMTCYYMGRLGRIDWIEKYFKVKKEKIDKMQRFLQGKGALMAFFAFLPAIGECDIHSPRIYEEQCMADHGFDVRRKTDTLHHPAESHAGSLNLVM